MSREEAAATRLRWLPAGLCFPLFFLVKTQGTGKNPACAIQMAIWKSSTFQPNPQGSKTLRKEVTKGKGKIPLWEMSQLE